ncbi:hypothetical protein, partial [Alkalibacillus haloalkaliphilus]|uniref:hypothetical protein n=1 Tax=Alkalibacillus haloalkaliphilus TaxID=94136 RepID=UPI002936CA3B
GTLWSMADAYGPLVALSVYGKMFGENGESRERPKLELAAEGLWDIIRKMRRDGVAYHQWIPFIHVGM